MHHARFAAHGLLLATLAFAPACADGTGADDTDHLGLKGDGSEFASDDGVDGNDEASFDTLAAIDPSEQPSVALLARNGRHPFKSYTNPRRNGPRYAGTTIFYPTDGAANSLSAVVMCPGFTAARSSIQDWGPFFASHGIVLMIIDTNSTLDQVPARADALWDAVQTLQNENSTSGTPLSGKLNGKFGLAGWSMGGGGTWIASKAHADVVKSAVTLAGHNATAPGGAQVARGSTVPTLMLNGADDTTILGGQNQTPNAYAQIPESTPKLAYEMRGFGHFAWGTPKTNNNISGQFVMAWEKLFLEGDDRYKAVLSQIPHPNAKTFKTNVF